MKPKLEDIDLYFITNAEQTNSHIFEDVEAALNAGVKIVQYREKKKTYDLMVQEALEIQKICKDRAIFIVNDRVDVAKAVDADGVHLGQKDLENTSYQEARRILGPNKIIGLSASTVEEAIAAYKAGADYLGVGPIFPTRTKTDANPPGGLELIRGVRGALTDAVIVAIGGIKLYNTADVMNAGADSIAVISAVTGKECVKTASRELIEIIRQYK